MPVPLTIVDSFTDRPFTGNPAGICQLDQPAPEAWMQAVAAEVNLAETAFLVPRADDDHDLRWFTPTVEVDLCGHATLAAAHVLGGTRRFHTRSGVLTCRPADAPAGTIEMDFPGAELTPADPRGWAAAFGLADGDVVAAGRTANGWDLVEARSAAVVRAAVLDRDAVLALGGHAILSADTTAAPDEQADAVSRVFVPKAGIDEDPVTGSAHCVIGPWLAARTGRTDFVALQASTRGGTVGLRIEGDRVILQGQAITVIEGLLAIDPPTR